MQNVNLTHNFLIAMPSLVDSVFSGTIMYICEHNEQGALGLVINRQMDLTLNSLLKQLHIPCKNSLPNEIPILFGGPVQIDCGFVLHHPVGKWQSTLVVNEEVGLTTSLDILQAIADSEGPEQILVTLGYSGWASGQIEQELAQNSWLTVPASPHIIFDLSSEERLPAAMQLLGIDFFNLSNEVGHA
ncbi:MAG: YqgE/AlgH family protein [Nitrosomonas sp.]|nr:YqgE/AlgH family protein [Nitrosomonas sp.]